MVKKEMILDQAMNLFLQKGYFPTSVQEIATSCGMSKGSIYKLFSSKEDILKHVVERNYALMLESAEKVDLDHVLSPRERFKKKIVLEMTGLNENREFFLLLYRLHSLKESEKIVPLMKKTKAVLVNWHKRCLLDAFSEHAIKNSVWDLVLLFQGTMREYMLLMTEEKIDIAPEEAAEKIIYLLEIIIEHQEASIPLVTDSMMEKFTKLAKRSTEKTQEEKTAEMFRSIEKAIDHSSLSMKEKSELQEMKTHLHEELHAAEARPAVAKALTSYLNERLGLNLT
ncbi:TetR/AcrR family transcriptional regulator [Alteribacillus sp. HJP-4]|uniref:TetR/AcrR family transcriptional regulator n=1 Tax=Alteribacillus sp. HJP-4 TaxID=2775394 RepID=UPI0035CD3085